VVKSRLVLSNFWHAFILNHKIGAYIAMIRIKALCIKCGMNGYFKKFAIENSFHIIVDMNFEARNNIDNTCHVFYNNRHYLQLTLRDN